MITFDHLIVHRKVTRGGPLEKTGGGGGGGENLLVQEFVLRTNLSTGFFFSGLQALHEFFFSYR